MASEAFKRKPVVFTSVEVFDKQFKANIDTCFCVVSKMLFKNTINTDGSIDMEQLVNVKKYELWSYIYYLYVHNNTTVPEFMQMRNPRTGKADATRFYDVVYGTDVASQGIQSRSANANVKGKKQITGRRTVAPETNAVRLIYFINNTIHSYKGRMINPIFEYLNQLLKQEIVAKLTEVKVNMVPIAQSKQNVRVGLEIS